MLQNVLSLSRQNINYDDSFYNLIYNTGIHAQKSPVAVLPPDINLLPNDNKYRSDTGHKKTEIVYTDFLKKKKEPKKSMFSKMMDVMHNMQLMLYDCKIILTEIKIK